MKTYWTIKEDSIRRCLHLSYIQEDEDKKTFRVSRVVHSSDGLGVIFEFSGDWYDIYSMDKECQTPTFSIDVRCGLGCFLDSMISYLRLSGLVVDNDIKAVSEERKRIIEDFIGAFCKR